MRWFSRAQKAEGLGGPLTKALLGSVEKKPNAWFSHAEKVKATVLENAVGGSVALFSRANKLHSVGSVVLNTSSATSE